MSELLNAARCENCRFFKAKGQKCRRFPPQIIFDLNTMERVTSFPQTNVSMWCGEFVMDFEVAKTALPHPNEEAVRKENG